MALDFGTYDAARVGQARTQNRLRQMQAEQAEAQMANQQRVNELARQLQGGPRAGSQRMERSGGNAMRNAALEAGGGPTREAASMMDQNMPAQQGGQQSAGMDPRMIELLARDPDLAGKIQQMRQQQSEQQRTQEDREAAIVASIGDRIERLPEGQREQAYQRLRQQAVNYGVDGEELPQEYTPGVFTLARARGQAAGVYEPPERGGERAEVMSGAALGMSGQAAKQSYEVKRDAQGNIIDINSLGGGGQTINVDASQGVPGVAEKATENLYNDLMKTGNMARTTERMVGRQAEELAQSGAKTNAYQPFLTGMQAYTEPLGIDLNGVLQGMGYDSLGELSSKQEFQRLGNKIRMQLLQGFSGNTSNKELDFTSSMMADLGDSPQATVKALAAMRALSRVKQQDSAEATRIMVNKGPKAFSEWYANMMDRGPERVRQLTKQYEKELRDRFNFGSSDASNDREQGANAGGGDDQLTPERIRTMPLADIPPVEQLSPEQQDALEKRLEAEGY